MPKKEFTEYNRDQKDFVKKPLFKGYDKNIFPPKSNMKESENQDASVFNVVPKLSMRKEKIKTGAWETKPKGWTGKSLKSLWNSLGGSVSSCMKKMEGKVKDAGAYCASLERKVESSTEKSFKFGDKILTSSKKVAKVVKIADDLILWIGADGESIGSDFIEAVELLKENTDAEHGEIPVEEGLTKEIPLR